MGNWLSCFHSSKSKSNANTNAADGRDDSVVARVPVEQGNHLEHQGKTYSVLFMILVFFLHSFSYTQRKISRLELVSR